MPGVPRIDPGAEPVDFLALVRLAWSLRAEMARGFGGWTDAADLSSVWGSAVTRSMGFGTCAVARRARLASGGIDTELPSELSCDGSNRAQL